MCACEEVKCIVLVCYWTLYAAKSRVESVLSILLGLFLAVFLVPPFVVFAVEEKTLFSLSSQTFTLASPMFIVFFRDSRMGIMDNGFCVLYSWCVSRILNKLSCYSCIIDIIALLSSPSLPHIASLANKRETYRKKKDLNSSSREKN